MTDPLFAEHAVKVDTFYFFPSGEEDVPGGFATTLTMPDLGMWTFENSSTTFRDIYILKLALIPVQKQQSLVCLHLIVPTLSTVPLPPALWLVSSGLLGLIGISRRKKA